jgi:hypothetical protein
MDPTDDQVACFEAGIKFGSLYHQFAGTPVSPESADSLARAMEAAIENQPHCEEVRVSIREDTLQDAIDAGDADYVEFTGEFADVDVVVEYEGVTVETAMRMDGDYPMMAVEDVRE